MANSWSDQRPDLTEKILSLWPDHSSGWIAHELGLTRNQVMGRVSRSKWRSDPAASRPRSSRQKRQQLPRPTLWTSETAPPEHRWDSSTAPRQGRPASARALTPSVTVRRRAPCAEMTKDELRAMLAQALAYTATLPVS